MTDFRKLGFDRVSQSIANAVNKPSGSNLTTGVIESGEVVSVTFAASTTGTARVKGRRTGAVPISNELTAAARSFLWSISGTTLTVTLDAAGTGTLTFWVF
jgi:hypothetical protein